MILASSAPIAKALFKNFSNSLFLVEGVSAIFLSLSAYDTLKSHSLLLIKKDTKCIDRARKRCAANIIISNVTQEVAIRYLDFFIDGVGQR